MSKPPQWALPPHDNIQPGVIVRLNDDGTIDEVCIDLGNGASYHLEQMDTGIYWMRLDWKDVNGKSYDQHITLSTARRAPIYPTVYC